MLVETLDASDIMVIQSPFGGLTVYTDAGPHWQGLGKVTKYQRRDTYNFKIPIRFNDNGHGTLEGSVQIDMPLDEKNIINLHRTYRSQDGIRAQVVEKVVNKSAYLTGPLMSSKESSSEKRNDLIRYIEDQVENGVYRTRQREVKVKDAINESIEKTVTIVELVMEPNGTPARQEISALTAYGLKPSNFAVKTLDYEESVEAQIRGQQKLFMEVQTSIAEAKKAEQRAATVEMEGKAKAAEARWKQEVIKAEQVTAAESRRDVSKLDADAAALGKQKAILEGQGESEKRKLIMAADGALDKKLDAYVRVNGLYAQAIQLSMHPLTPSVVMGAGADGKNIGLSLADMLMVKTAKELGLNTQPNGK